MGKLADKAAIHEFLTRQKYGVVSSSLNDGTPQSALVGIAVTAEFEIIFDTLKTTRKYRNLIARPSCSFVIGWENEQTVQLEGEAFEPQGEQLGRYQQIYFATWPDGRTRIAWDGSTWIVVRPTWLRYSDFSKNPPLIEEMTMEISI